PVSYPPLCLDSWNGSFLGFCVHLIPPIRALATANTQFSRSITSSPPPIVISPYHSTGSVPQ
ncbi:unnamed protein product, partial [Tuber aestivum]